MKMTASEVMMRLCEMKIHFIRDGDSFFAVKGEEHIELKNIDVGTSDDFFQMFADTIRLLEKS